MSVMTSHTIRTGPIPTILKY